MLRAVACLALVAAVVQQPAAAPVAYPEGYRSWTHVKSMVILPGHQLENPFAGVHHVYANSQALQGLKSGRYADGAVLVFDLLTGDSKDNAITEGARKLVGVMQRDAQRYAATGGWGFEGFGGDSRTDRLAKDGGTSCYQCHQARAQQSFVFSEWRQ